MRCGPWCVIPAGRAGAIGNGFSPLGDVFDSGNRAGGLPLYFHKVTPLPAGENLKSSLGSQAAPLLCRAPRSNGVTGHVSRAYWWKASYCALLAVQL